MSADAGGVGLYRAAEGSQFFKSAHPMSTTHIAYPAAQAAAMERVVECACAFRLASSAKDERGAAQLQRDLFHATDNYLAHIHTQPSGESNQHQPRTGRGE